MDSNPDFMKIVYKDVELLYPRLDQPYRYNPQKRRSEPCDPRAPQAAYSVNFTLSRDEAVSLFNQAKAHYEARLAAGAQLPPFGTVFGMKKLEDGRVQVAAKKSAMRSDGTAPNKAPIVRDANKVDADGKPVLLEGEDLRIWSGSRGHVALWAYPTTDPDGTGGVSFLIKQIAITEAIYGGDSYEDDFGEPPQPQNDYSDDFGAGQAPAQPATQTPAQPAHDPFAASPDPSMQTTGQAPAQPAMETPSNGGNTPSDEELPF